MALDSENLDLSKIALVAAIGDRQDKGEGKTMLGENAKVLKTAVDAGFVESFQDLLLVKGDTPTCRCDGIYRKTVYRGSYMESQSLS